MYRTLTAALFIALAGLMNLVVILDALYLPTDAGRGGAGA